MARVIYFKRYQDGAAFKGVVCEREREKGSKVMLSMAKTDCRCHSFAVSFLIQRNRSGIDLSDLGTKAGIYDRNPSRQSLKRFSPQEENMNPQEETLRKKK